jgi:hypothetical protein
MTAEQTAFCTAVLSPTDYQWMTPPHPQGTILSDEACNLPPLQRPMMVASLCDPYRVTPGSAPLLGKPFGTVLALDKYDLVLRCLGWHAKGPDGATRCMVLLWDEATNQAVPVWLLGSLEVRVVRYAAPDDRNNPWSLWARVSSGPAVLYAVHNKQTHPLSGPPAGYAFLWSPEGAPDPAYYFWATGMQPLAREAVEPPFQQWCAFANSFWTKDKPLAP